MRKVPRSERPSPYRLLGLAMLLVLALAQVAGMVMLARSQVERAELRALAERAARLNAANCGVKDPPGAGTVCRTHSAAAGQDGLPSLTYASFQ